MAISVGVNSYITLIEANAYLVDNLQYATYWSVLDDATRTLYLIESCKQIESVQFDGRKTSNTQDLQFPRDFTFKTNYTPINVKQAQAIQALYLAENWSMIHEREKMDSMNISDYGVGEIVEKRQKLKSLLCSEAIARLKLYSVFLTPILLIDRM